MSSENLLAQSQDMLTLWQLYQLQFYLDRMQKNLGLINSAPNSQIVTLVGGNLFSLASQYYGDQKQWVLIANANNLKDPMLVGQNTLIIPPWNGVDTGGILQ